MGWDKVSIDGVKPVYIIFGKNKILNNLRFYREAVFYIKRKLPRLVILNRSFFFCIFKILNHSTTFVYDIRSGIVSSSFWKRTFYTWLIRFDLLFFKNITVISESLAKQLRIRKYHVLPLGAEKFDLSPKYFKSLKLLYVGSFLNRRIEDTIKGFRMYLDDNNVEYDISYHIYGFGDTDSEKTIKSLIFELNLLDRVYFHGRFAYHDLPLILGAHNIGVSYIPITKFYDVQPPTKTFEYLLAGMPVIATNTQENARVINKSNGVLINDNPLAFNRGLQDICTAIYCNQYSSNEIIGDSIGYTWVNIVVSNFKKYIDNLLEEQNVADK